MQAGYFRTQLIVFLGRAVAKQNVAAAFRFELLRYEVCGAGLIVTQNGEYNLNSPQTLAGPA